MIPKKRIRNNVVDWEKEYKTAKNKLWEQNAHAYSIYAKKYVPKAKFWIWDREKATTVSTSVKTDLR